MRLKSIILFSSLICFGCREGNTPEPVAGFEYFSYGSFFGECLGYCQAEIKIQNELIMQQATGWNLEGGLPKIERKEGINRIYFEELTKHLNFDVYSDESEPPIPVQSGPLVEVFFLDDLNVIQRY